MSCGLLKLILPKRENLDNMRLHFGFIDSLSNAHCACQQVGYARVKTVLSEVNLFLKSWACLSDLMNDSEGSPGNKIHDDLGMSC